MFQVSGGHLTETCPHVNYDPATAGFQPCGPACPACARDVPEIAIHAAALDVVPATGDRDRLTRAAVEG